MSKNTYRGLEALEQFRKEMFGDEHIDVAEAAKQYDEAKEKEIFDTSVNGAIKQNKINNRVFCSMFDRDDAIAYEKIFLTFKENPTNKMYLQTLESDLKFENQRMINENKCPIEIMLYASRIINSSFAANAKLYDYLAREISNTLSASDFMFKFGKDVIDHILTNWNWSNQIGAVILGVGFYGRDRELIQAVIDKASKLGNANYNYSICKMIVASSDSYFAETLLDYCKQLQDNPDDNKILKLILDDGGFEKISGDPKLIEEACTRGGISGFSRKMFNKLLTKYQNKGFDVNLGKSDAMLDEIVNRIKNSEGAEKTEALNDLYENYFLSGKSKRITSALHKIRDKKSPIPEMKPYLERFLSKDRACGANSIISVYFDYQRLCSLPELLEFLDKQLKMYPDEEITINITKYLKIRDDEEREDYAYDAIGQYLLASEPTVWENSSIKTVLKFDVPFIKYLKYSMSDILVSDEIKPFELNNALRNYLALIKEDGALKRSLEQNDEIINTFVSQSQNGFVGLGDATISLIIKIVSYYKNTKNTSSILMNISKSDDVSERIREEAREIISSHKKEVPSE